MTTATKFSQRQQIALRATLDAARDQYPGIEFRTYEPDDDPPEGVTVIPAAIDPWAEAEQAASTGSRS
jgi:hypothetical protein